MRNPALLLIAAATTVSVGACRTATEVDTPPEATVIETAAPTTSSEQSGAIVSARRFVIVTGESEAAYEVTEEFFGGAARLDLLPGLVDAVGTTTDVSGEVSISGEAEPTIESGEFVVDLSTLTSDDSRRDRRIREEWLESSTYPLATFSAREIRGFPGDYQEGDEVTFQVAGDLTIRDVTNPAIFDVTATASPDGVSGTATTQLLMTDFGFQPPDIMGMLSVEDEVKVTVSFVAREE